MEDKKFDEAEDGAKLSPESDAPTAEQLKKIEQLKGEKKEEGPKFEDEFSALCTRHGVTAAVCAVQTNEEGSAFAVAYRCDPWRMIGLAKMIDSAAVSRKRG